MRECCHPSEKWKVLLVDDEEDVILITKLALEGYTYYDKPLEFLTAKSAKEAIAFLDNHDDIAVVFLDIIMEHDQAGFDVIRHLRNIQENYQTRVVIRTGEPGEYPEATVVNEYEINDYKSKGELTEERLHCTMTTALRSYCDLLMLEHYKNSESVMIHKSKLMLFGEMMGMMLHQWQQPVTSISLICDLAKEDLKDYDIPPKLEQDLTNYITKVKNQTEFLGTISRDFRQFFKVSKNKEQFPITESIEKTLFIVSDLIKEQNVCIETDIAEDAMLYGDRNEFKHVILNLIKNTMDAYKNNQTGEKKIHIRHTKTPQHACLSFIDFAGGIKEELLPNRIFEPYNTSKAEGSGIGLWMCKLIVQNMNGTIKASNENGGARFDMHFSLS